MGECAVVVRALIAVTVPLVLAAGVAHGQRPPPRPMSRVLINGTAYRSTVPAGPDLGGGSLRPFQPDNPRYEVWAATRAQNERLLDTSRGPENIQVSHSGPVRGASRPVSDFSEGMLAIDPTDPRHLLGTSKFFYSPETYGFYTGVFESFDGGLTWSQEQPDGLEAYALTSDPVVTFDEQGTGHAGYMTRGPTGVGVVRKPMGGEWSAPVLVDHTTNTDKEWAVGDQDPRHQSPYAGNLYMSWTAIGSRSAIVLSRATSRYARWSSPQQLTTGSVQGSIPGVAPKGTVYVLYERYNYGGSGRLEIVKSTNGGETFAAPKRVANFTSVPAQLPNTTFRTFTLPGFAVSPVDGALYAVWADYRLGDADIYFTRSLTGISWETAVRLNDDPVKNGIDQFMPQVTVAPNGRVAVMWFDRRLPCPAFDWIPGDHVGRQNLCIDTFMARSLDRGQTWGPNLRVSAQTWDPSLNMPLVNASTGFIGDYQGIASSEAFDFPFWNATANLGDNPDNRQEFFVARVPPDWSPDLPEPTPTSTETPTHSPSPAPPATPSSTGVPSATPSATASAVATPTPGGPPAVTSTAEPATTPLPSATPHPRWTVNLPVGLRYFWAGGRQ